MRFLAVFLSLSIMATVAGCTEEESTSGAPTAGTPATTSPSLSPSPPGGSASAVRISGFAFAPADVTIPAGGTVTWTNEDSATHTATADDGSWDSGRLAKGDSHEETFATAGTFAYHCAVHPGMTGTVTVT